MPLAMSPLTTRAATLLALCLPIAAAQSQGPAQAQTQPQTFAVAPTPAALSTSHPATPYQLPQVQPDPHPLQILTPANEVFTFIKVGATTCHRYTMVEALIPPGAGPLPHIHHYTDEWFYFPKGGITLQMSMQASPDLNVVPGINAPKQILHQVKTTDGSLFYGARYYMHGYKNTSDSAKTVITIWTPDDPTQGISNYFRAVGQPIVNGKIPAVNPLNKQLFVSQAPKYGINQSSSFDQYVSGVDNTFNVPADNHVQELEDLLRNTHACPPHAAAAPVAVPDLRPAKTTANPSKP